MILSMYIVHKENSSSWIIFLSLFQETRRDRYIYRYREVEIEEGSSSLSLPNLRLLIFVTLYTLPNLRLLATLYNLRLLATLYNLRLLEEEDEDSLEFLRMNHFPSVYVRFSTYPVIHYFSMLVTTQSVSSIFIYLY